MNKNCICGKLSATNCLFDTCKNCCKSILCKRHNPSSSISNIIEQCCMCLKLNTDVHLHSILYKNKFIYYCDNCHDLNKNIFDNMAKTNFKNHELTETIEPIKTIESTKSIETTEPIETQKNYIYEVEDIPSCPCTQISAQNCILKTCKSCCVAKHCIRHLNVNLIDDNSESCCMVCGRTDFNCKYDKFFNKKINKIVSYCQFCYKNNTPIFNNIINNSNVDKSKLNIEYINIDASVFPEFIEDKKAIRTMNLILDKIDTGTLTWNIINDKLKKIKNFHLSHIPDYYTYLCPMCEKTEQFDNTISCDTCGKVMCGECIIFRERYLDTKTFCPDCVDVYGKLYNKYKGTVLTSEILKDNDVCPFSEFDLYFFDVDGYDLTYKCPLCTIENDFNIDNYSKCHKCDNYVCTDCHTIKLNNCQGDCDEPSCSDEEYIFYCSKCIEQYNITISDDEYEDEDDYDYENDQNKKIKISRKRCSSPCELATKDDECNICYVNKKKYACVPCGHLCMCGECANKIEDKCPICKISITTIIKIFL